VTTTRVVPGEGGAPRRVGEGEALGAVGGRHPPQPVVLVACLLVALIALGPVGYATAGMSGVWSVVAAASTCMAAGLLAWGWTWRWEGLDPMLLRVYWAMGIRTLIPLAVCLVVYSRGGRLAEGGFVYYLLVFYCITLIVQTSMWIGRAREGSTGAPAG
jgi:hypothetical protein